QQIAEFLEACSHTMGVLIFGWETWVETSRNIHVVWRCGDCNREFDFYIGYRIIFCGVCCVNVLATEGYYLKKGALWAPLDRLQILW
ncbi:MAG: hypothetical protein KAR25_06985, partial [Methanosarcinales archaeon]|nr:hypothetical protein [Methanosarcinales archaeon]